MSERAWVYFDIEKILRESPKAFLLLDIDGKEWWVPKSQVADANDYQEGDEKITLAINEWFCEKEGIEP